MSKIDRATRVQRQFVHPQRTARHRCHPRARVKSLPSSAQSCRAIPDGRWHFGTSPFAHDRFRPRRSCEMICPVGNVGPERSLNQRRRLRKVSARCFRWRRTDRLRRSLGFCCINAWGGSPDSGHSLGGRSKTHCPRDCSSAESLSIIAAESPVDDSKANRTASCRGANPNPNTLVRPAMASTITSPLAFQRRASSRRLHCRWMTGRFGTWFFCVAHRITRSKKLERERGTKRAGQVRLWPVELLMNFGSNTARGEDFQQQRVTKSAIDDVNLSHATAERFQAGFHFGNHSRVNHAIAINCRASTEESEWMIVSGSFLSRRTPLTSERKTNFSAPKDCATAIAAVSALTL